MLLIKKDFYNFRFSEILFVLIRSYLLVQFNDNGTINTLK